ncbi:hypothetical protein G6F57_019046 [Rhizopus arrhizus]|nr:hypothetical protein G6F57_019046 [Rhizopus arrhizus]
MAVDGSPGKLYALAAPVELDIGGVAVRDVSFAVLGQDDLPRIGLDVLRALGRVRVSKDALVIQATASPVPCTRRMATLSSLWADAYDVRYPIRAGKQNVLVKVDTGFNGAFQARGTQRRHPVRGGDHAGHDRGGSAEPADGPGAVARAQAAVQPGLARGLCRDPALQPVHGC